MDDCTKKSKRLACLSKQAFGLFPYIFQETDDYGCFLADADYIKGQRFSLIKWVSSKMIEKALLEYNSIGMLFFWNVGLNRYGYFVGFEGKSGKFLSKRRKRETPEPNPENLAKFLEDNNRFQTLPKTSKNFPKVNESKVNEIKEKYNLICKSLPKVEILSQTRKDKIAIRLKEHPDIEWWEKVFEKADKVHLKYPKTGKEWSPSFDWLIENDNNAVKVIEGNYDKPKSGVEQFKDE